MSALIDFYEKMDSTAVLTALFVCTTFYLVLRRDPYADIPAVGSANFLLSYIGAARYIIRGPQMLQEGYEKFGKTTGIFRIPSITSWHVFVCGAKELEEIKSLKGEAEMSSEVAGRILQFALQFKQILSGDYTFGKQLFDNPYHSPIARTQLTKNLDTWFESVRAEIVDAFEELIPPTTDWSSFNLYPVVTQIIARTANCVIISDPTIYRERDYLTMIMNFTVNTALAAFTLNLFPEVLKPLARRWLTNVPQTVSTATKALRKTVEEREAKLVEYGSDYSDKPIDVLSFLMDAAQGEERTAENLALRVLIFNFASVHTTSMTLSLILRDLADRSEYIKPLREEVESVISKDGITKASLGKMRKLESFMMESQRVKASRAITSNRWTVKDYTFANGVCIPKNTMIAVPMRARHYDGTLFDNPNKFDGFRFCKTDGEGNDNVGRNLSLTSAISPIMLFGMGEHICPGRFLVTAMLKIAIIQFLLNYDAKLDPNNFPRDSWIGPDLVPSDSVTLLVRERKKEVVDG